MPVCQRSITKGKTFKMADRLIFVALAAIVYQVSAQSIGSISSNQLFSPCQQPLITPCKQQSQILTVQPQNQPLSPCQQQNLVATNQQPVYATTIIDNSVSNALANALQLLIVSDLIESTLNARNVEVVNPIGSPCGCGLVDAEIYPVQIEYPFVQEPCGCGSYPLVQEVVQNCGCSSYPVIQEVQSYGCGSYPIVQEVVQTYASPVQYYGSPVAAEVVFPSEIPAQLTCNFGYVPSAQPVVQVVGVEPLTSFSQCGCGSYYY